MRKGKRQSVGVDMKRLRNAKLRMGLEQCNMLLHFTNTLFCKQKFFVVTGRRYLQWNIFTIDRVIEEFAKSDRQTLTF